MVAARKQQNEILANMLDAWSMSIGPDRPMTIQGIEEAMYAGIEQEPSNTHEGTAWRLLRESMRQCTRQPKEQRLDMTKVAVALRSFKSVEVEADSSVRYRLETEGKDKSGRSLWVLRVTQAKNQAPVSTHREQQSTLLRMADAHARNERYLDALEKAEQGNLVMGQAMHDIISTHKVLRLGLQLNLMSDDVPDGVVSDMTQLALAIGARNQARAKAAKHTDLDSIIEATMEATRKVHDELSAQGLDVGWTPALVDTVLRERSRARRRFDATAMEADDEGADEGEEDLF